MGFKFCDDCDWWSRENDSAANPRPKCRFVILVQYPQLFSGFN